MRLSVVVIDLTQGIQVGKFCNCLAHGWRRDSGFLPLVGRIIIGPTCSDPFIDFGELEFPQSADLVRWQVPALTPAVDGVFRHAWVGLLARKLFTSIGAQGTQLDDPRGLVWLFRDYLKVEY